MKAGVVAIQRVDCFGIANGCASGKRAAKELAMTFKNPANGLVEKSRNAGLWSFLFGIFYFAYKGAWMPAAISFVAAFLTGGVAWLVIPFFADGMLRKDYLRRGWVEMEEPAEDAAEITPLAVVMCLLGAVFLVIGVVGSVRPGGQMVIGFAGMATFGFLAWWFQRGAKLERIEAAAAQHRQKIEAERKARQAQAIAALAAARKEKSTKVLSEEPEVYRL